MTRWSRAQLDVYGDALDRLFRLPPGDLVIAPEAATLLGAISRR